MQGDDLTPLSAFLPGIMGAMKLAPAPKALTVQGKHHHTTAKQINDLLEVREGSPEMGFMTLCSLPRTDPGNRLQYKRETGPFRLVMIAGGDNKLPFGNLPRLLLAWVCTEVVQTKNRELQLGHSLAGFMRQLGMQSNSGGSRADRTRLRHQIDRLFNAHVQLIYEAPGRKSTISSTVADRTDLWWDYKAPTQDTLWQSSIRLAYVAVSRGAHDAQLFTNDREKLPAVLGHEVSRASAHTPQHQSEQSIQPPQQEIAPKQEHSYGLGLGL